MINIKEEMCGSEEGELEDGEIGDEDEEQLSSPSTAAAIKSKGRGNLSSPSPLKNKKPKSRKGSGSLEGKTASLTPSAVSAASSLAESGGIKEVWTGRKLLESPPSNVAGGKSWLQRRANKVAKKAKKEEQHHGRDRDSPERRASSKTKTKAGRTKTSSASGKARRGHSPVTRYQRSYKPLPMEPELAAYEKLLRDHRTIQNQIKEAKRRQTSSHGNKSSYTPDRGLRSSRGQRKSKEKTATKSVKQGLEAEGNVKDDSEDEEMLLLQLRKDALASLAQEERGKQTRQTEDNMVLSAAVVEEDIVASEIRGCKGETEAVTGTTQDVSGGGGGGGGGVAIGDETGVTSQGQFDNYEEVEMEVDDEDDTNNPSNPDAGMAVGHAIYEMIGGVPEAPHPTPVRVPEETEPAGETGEEEENMLRAQLLRAMLMKRAARAQADKVTGSTGSTPSKPLSPASPAAPPPQSQTPPPHAPPQPSDTLPIHNPPPDAHPLPPPASHTPPLLPHTPPLLPHTPPLLPHTPPLLPHQPPSQPSTPPHPPFRSSSPLAIRPGQQDAYVKPKPPKIPVHQPVVINFDEEDSDDSEEDSNSLPFMGQLDFFLKEVRNSSSNKDPSRGEDMQVSDRTEVKLNPLPAPKLLPKTPDAIRMAPTPHKEEYHRLRKEIVRREHGRLAGRGTTNKRSPSGKRKANVSVQSHPAAAETEKETARKVMKVTISQHGERERLVSQGQGTRLISQEGTSAALLHKKHDEPMAHSSTTNNTKKVKDLPVERSSPDVDPLQDSGQNMVVTAGGAVGPEGRLQKENKAAVSTSKQEKAGRMENTANERSVGNGVAPKDSLLEAKQKAEDQEAATKEQIQEWQRKRQQYSVLLKKTDDLLVQQEQQLMRRRKLIDQARSKVDLLKKEIAAAEKTIGANQAQMLRHVKQKSAIGEKMARHLALDEHARQVLAKLKGVSLAEISQSNYKARVPKQSQAQAAAMTSTKRRSEAAVLSGADPKKARMLSQTADSKTLKQTADLKALQDMERELAEKIRRFREAEAQKARVGVASKSVIPEQKVRLIRQLSSSKPSAKIYAKDVIKLNGADPKRGPNDQFEAVSDEGGKVKDQEARRKSWLDENPTLTPNLKTKAKPRNSVVDTTLTLGKVRTKFKTGSQRVKHGPSTGQKSRSRDTSVECDLLQWIESEEEKARSGLEDASPTKEDPTSPTKEDPTSTYKPKSLSSALLKQIKEAQREAEKSGPKFSSLDWNQRFSSPSVSRTSRLDGHWCQIVDARTGDQTAAESETANAYPLKFTASRLAPYKSPLLPFKAFRLSPLFRVEAGLSVRSKSFSNKLDAKRPLCQYELNGTCNDDDCVWQHERDYLLSSREMLTDLLAYNSVKPPGREEARGKVGQPSPQKHAPAMVEKDKLATCINSVLDGHDKGVVTRLITNPRTWRPRPRSKRLLSEDDICSEILPLRPPLWAQSRTQAAPAEAALQPDVDEGVRYYTGADPAGEGGSSSQGEAGRGRWAGVGGLEAAVLDRPHDIALWLQLAASLLKEASVDKALNALSRALEQNSGCLSLWLEYLRLYRGRARAEEYVEMCVKATELVPSYQTWWLLLEAEDAIPVKLNICQKILLFLKTRSKDASRNRKTRSASFQDACNSNPSASGKESRISPHGARTCDPERNAEGVSDAVPDAACALPQGKKDATPEEGVDSNRGIPSRIEGKKDATPEEGVDSDRGIPSRIEGKKDATPEEGVASDRGIPSGVEGKKDATPEEGVDSDRGILSRIEGKKDASLEEGMDSDRGIPSRIEGKKDATPEEGVNCDRGVASRIEGTGEERALGEELIALGERQADRSTREELSHQILEVLLYGAQLHLNRGREEEAAQYLENVLKVSDEGQGHDDELRLIMVTSDLLLGWLSLMYIHAVGSLPPSLFDPADKLPSRIVKKDLFPVPWQRKGSSQDRQEIDDLWEAAVTSCSEGRPSSEQLSPHIVELYTIEIEEQLGSDDWLSQLCCLDMSGCRPSREGEELYVRCIEALLRRQIKSADINMHLDMGLSQLPHSCQLYFMQARLQMSGSEGNPLTPLKHCILVFYQVPFNANETFPLPAFLELYRHQLKLPLPVDFQPPPPHPDAPPELTEESRVYMWLCYILLTHHSLGVGPACEAFETALVSLQGRKAVELMWIEYLNFVASQGQTTSQHGIPPLRKLVLRCLDSTATRFPLPLPPSPSSTLKTPAPAHQTWADFSFHSRVAQLYVGHVGVAERMEVWEGLQLQMPDNVCLAFRACEHAVQQGFSQLGLQIAYSVLRRKPQCLVFWQIVISLALQEQRYKEVEALYEQAVLFHHTSASLWKDYIAFVIAHKGEDRLSSLLQHTQAIGLSQSDILPSAKP